MATQETAESIRSQFAKSLLIDVLGAISDGCNSPWKIADDASEIPPPEEPEIVRIRLVMEGSLEGAILLVVTRVEATDLASKLLQSPATDFGEEESTAFLKVITSGAKSFCSKLEVEFGAFTINAFPADEEASTGAAWSQITASNGDDGRCTLWLSMDQKLTKALALHSREKSGPSHIEKLIRASQGNMAAEQVNLELVMDVELNVTLRFGQRQLTLREVLELTSGSVVELDRQVEEPVELLLDGILIARGEAVVIDGNYGLRVTEVSQPLTPSLVH